MSVKDRKVDRQRRPLRRFQVWLRGSDLCDVLDTSKRDAARQIREFYGYKRLPKDTLILEIPADYYDQINKLNKQAGFDATNL